MEYLDAARTVATYESMGGDHCFVRYGLVTVVEEVPGWAPAIREREIVEAVFVAADEVAEARWVLAGLTAASNFTLSGMFEARGITFRLPHRVRPGTVQPFPAARSRRAVA